MLIRELFENTAPGMYVYHASYLPDQATGLKSLLTKGLQPSKEGYAGPGVYFAYDPEGGYYHVSKEEATMLRVKWADLVAKFGTYPTNKNGIERDENEIIVPGVVPASMIEIEYFPGEWWDLNSAYQASLGPVDESDDSVKIKLGDNAAKARAWIDKVYTKYPHTMQNNHVMVWGSGDDQQFAMFELVPSFSKRGAVEVKWFQAYPLRAGVGSKAMKELQTMAREDGIALTLFPWDKGQVSQAKLTKFYKGHGFKPTVKGGKAMAWENFAEARTNPDQNLKFESGFKELAAVAKTITNPENWAISMTSEPKLGINPQVGISEDTPKGIYFYPLNYALDKTSYGKLPWGHDYPYIQLFQYDRSGEMTKQTQVDPVKLKQALSQYCSEEVIQSAIDEPEYDGTPYWFIYDCLSRLGKNDETNVVRWNKVLRDLGFTSVYDDGAGWIAYNEPTQGVVLDPRIIKQLKTIVNKKKSKVVTPAVIEQAIFETMDMELASNRAWQAYDPDGSKLRAAAQEYAKKPEFKPYYGKPGSEEIFDKAESWGRYGARQLSQEAWEWWQEQRANKPAQ